MIHTTEGSPSGRGSTIHTITMLMILLRITITQSSPP
jgi:hypothetical protein